MKEHKHAAFLPETSPTQLITSQLRSDEQHQSIDRVYVAPYGVFVCWILEYYQGLPIEEQHKEQKLEIPYLM